MAKETTPALSGIKPWDYDESIALVLRFYESAQRAQLNLVRELYAAKKALTNPGYRSDLTSGHLARGPQLRTWEDYCEAVEIPKRTADRWIQLYDPEEDRLLSMDEFKARLVMGFEELIKELEGSVGKPIDWRPDGWSVACERYYTQKIKERKLLDIAQRDHFDQLELFNREYLASLSDRLDVASPEEILEFGRLCEDLRPFAVKEVPVPKQVRVVKLVEAALSEFQPAVRDKVARFVAETIMRRDF